MLTKKIINVYSDTSVELTIESLEKEIPRDVSNSAEYPLIMPKIKQCIFEYSNKARKFSEMGSSIFISKEFKISDTIIRVNLEHPKKRNFIKKLFNFFQDG